MNVRKVIAFLLILLVLSFPLSVVSQSGVIVNNADSILDTSFTHSQDLVDTISSIGPRVIVEYTDSTAPHNLIEIPLTLQTLVSSVPMMVIVEFADSTASYDLIEMPTSLQTLVLPVIRLIIVEYADSTNGMSLTYPTDLMNDSQSPEISQVTAREGSGVIVWITDEFATSTVLYGIQTGVYTGTVSDPLYVKQHEVALPGLESGTTYYYKTRSTDRSGNTATSSEYSFTVQVLVYLPVVIRNQ